MQHLRSTAPSQHVRGLSHGCNELLASDRPLPIMSRAWETCQGHVGMHEQEYNR